MMAFYMYDEDTAPKKRDVPQNVIQKMEVWRQSIKELPQEFIDFHHNLAVEHLNSLKDQFEFRVIEMDMVSDGWDGMRVLMVVIRTKDYRTVRLEWNPGNQEFFYRTATGSRPLRDEYL